ncbi:MAG: putative transcriptional regulator [Glaciecola sp.]|jgi:putative transcriptional regulator
MDTEANVDLVGRLLVAAPVLDDPNFARTVVLIIDHDDDGSVGVVLNRPGAQDVGQLLPRYEPLAAPPRVLFGGGPVTPDGVLCVARGTCVGSERFKAFLGELGVLGLDQDEPGDGIEQVRLFHGYAGWTSGQLQSELDAGAWFVQQASPDDVFSQDPDNLWAHVLRRGGGPNALLATLPEDPSTN